MNPANKSLRVILFLTALLLLGLSPLPLLAKFLGLFVIGNLLASPSARARLQVTLSVNEIVQDTLDAFRSMVPQLSSMSTDLSSKTARKGDQIIAHIAGLPVIQSYDATSGFELNQVEADTLITDVPVTLDTLNHVPVRVKWLTQLASRKDLYAEAIRNMAWVLGKNVVDIALGKVSPLAGAANNFSNQVIEAPANVALDTMEKIRTQLNVQRAGVIGRYGIVNSTFAQNLQLDQRVGSAFFYGQLNGDYGYRIFRNLSGCQTIYEYPDMPATNNLQGFFADRRAITICTRLPDLQDDIAKDLSIPQIATFQVATDPESGLSLLMIMWQKQGTFDVWVTVTLLFGITAGKQNGNAATITDNAGLRCVTN